MIRIHIRVFFEYGNAVAGLHDVQKAAAVEEVKNLLAGLEAKKPVLFRILVVLEKNQRIGVDFFHGDAFLPGQWMVMGHEGDGRDTFLHDYRFQIGICSALLVHFTERMEAVDDGQPVLIFIDAFEVLPDTGFPVGIVGFRVILFFKIHQALEDLSRPVTGDRDGIADADTERNPLYFFYFCKNCLCRLDKKVAFRSGNAAVTSTFKHRVSQLFFQGFEGGAQVGLRGVQILRSPVNGTAALDFSDV